MKGHALLARIANTPWALLPSVCDSLQLVVMYHSEGRRLDQADVDAIVAGRGDVVARGPGAGAGDAGYTVRSGIAVIPIGGVIAKHASDVNGSSQPRGTSTEAVRQALAAANADGMVNAIMLHIESPGGTVDGVDALASDIAASGKPVWSVISDLGASAAYWIASQASRVFAGTPTTEVGSIGVYTVLADMAQYYKQRGIELTTISSGPNKGLGADGRVTDQLKADMQARIDELNAQFVSTVAKGRKKTTDQVRGWASGKVFGAPAALSMGLIDAIQSPEAVLAEMARTFDPRNTPRMPAARAAESPITPIAGANSPTAESAAAVVTAATAAEKESPVKIIAALSALAVPLLLSPDNPNAPGGGGVDVEPSAKDVIAKITPEQAAAIRRQVASETQKIAALERLPGHNAASRKLIQDARRAQEAGTPVDLAALQSAVVEAIAQTDTSASDVANPVRVSEDRVIEGRNAAALCLAARAVPSLESTLTAGGESADRLARALGFRAQGQAGSGAAALRVLDDARSQGLGRASIRHLARQCAERLGLSGSVGFDDERLFRAVTGHSSSDFPNLLSNTANKILLARFTEQSTTWRRWTRRGVANDYKDQTLLRVSEIGNFEKLLEGAVANFTTLNERKNTVAVEAYAKKFKYTYQMFRNDDLQAFADIPTQFGLAAARLPETIAWTLLQANPTMSDSNAFFSTAHNNIAGSPAVLSKATLQAMATALMNQKGSGPDQVPLDLTPRFVLTGVGNKFTADALYRDVTDGTQSNPNVRNTVQGMFEPIVSSRVTSSTAFWGLADPAQAAAVVIYFLDGEEMPVITELPAQSSMSVELEAVIRGVGGAMNDWEAAQYNAGS